MNKKSILLVEDNPDDEMLVLLALKNSQIMNEIAVVHNGEEALDYLFGMGPYSARDVTLQPQVILLDLKLPKVSGLEVLEHLRADARTRLIPVVILTSSTEDEDVIAGYRLGANSFLRKPMDFEHFSKAVEQMGLYWMMINEAPPKRLL